MVDSSRSHYIRYLEALKDAEVFKNVDTSALAEMLHEMRSEKWSLKTFRNSNSTALYIHFIVSGRLKVYQVNPTTDREHIIFILSKGDMFDILLLLDNEPHEIFWEALDDMELLKIPIDKMQEWITVHPEINKTLLHYIGSRMRQLENIATDISLHNTLVRLTNLLLSNINGKTHKLQLINNLPNDEIAGLIGTTRAVVNRHIQKLKKCGAITVHRKSIDVKNIQALLAIVENKYNF
ncbi:MAG: Crp/Fnr family transcriptional regulator [Aequorivita sp.]